MTEDLPESIQKAIYEVYALANRGHMSYRAADELEYLIEQKYLKSLWLAERRAGPAVLSRKAFSNRVDQLRRKGIRVMGGPEGEFRAYVAVWNRERDYKGSVFSPGSCSNLDEFVHRGKIALEHNQGRQFGIPWSAENDDYGLLIKGQFLKNDLGRCMRTVIRERLEHGKAVPASLCLMTPCLDGVEFTGVDGTPTRIITDFRLADECSYVGWPAQPLATFL